MTIYNSDNICQLLPHTGSMCLLNYVLDWDKENITCVSFSQSYKENPLRYKNRLPVESSVEYAAQAMGVHRALIYADNQKPAVGYLASLRNISFFTDYLDEEKKLFVNCKYINGDQNGFIYDFFIKNSTRTLVNGRAMVVLPIIK